MASSPLDILDRFIPVLRAIEGDLAKNKSIDELAHEAYYSRFHFQRLFKEVCGRPLGQYLRSRRMTYASELLLNTRWELQRVAEEVGYTSSRTLHKAFLAHYGISPLHYRRQKKEHWHRYYAPLSEAELVHLHSDGISRAPVIEELPQRNFLGLTQLLPMNSPDSLLLLEPLRVEGLLTPHLTTQLSCFVWSSPEERMQRLHHIAFLFPQDIFSEGAPLLCENFSMPPVRVARFHHRGSMTTYAWSQRYIWQDWTVAQGWSIDEDIPSELRFNYRGATIDPTGFEVLLPISPS